jgi:predicted membrane channel-forming protein YqfA (hemolysin III family)
VTLFVPVFRTPPWRPVRACVFGRMGSLAFVPLIAGVFMYGLYEMMLQGGKFYVIAAVLYLAFGVFYAARIQSPPLKINADFNLNLDGLKNGPLDDLIFGAIRISCFISRAFWGCCRIFMGCCRRLDIRILLVGAELRFSSRGRGELV